LQQRSGRERSSLRVSFLSDDIPTHRVAHNTSVTVGFCVTRLGSFQITLPTTRYIYTHTHWPTDQTPSFEGNFGGAAANSAPKMATDLVREGHPDSLTVNPREKGLGPLHRAACQDMGNMFLALCISKRLDSVVWRQVEAQSAQNGLLNGGGENRHHSSARIPSVRTNGPLACREQ
jgi:hypothetical protein